MVNIIGLYMQLSEKKYYIVPVVEVNEIEAERGYAGSMLEDPIEQPEQNW